MTLKSGQPAFETLTQATSMGVINRELISCAFGCYFWPWPCSTTTDTISPLLWLFLGHLRAAEVAPKRGITHTETCGLFLKPSNPHFALKGWNNWHVRISGYFSSEGGCQRPWAAAPICRHTVTLLFYTMAQASQLPTWTSFISAYENMANISASPGHSNDVLMEAELLYVLPQKTHIQWCGFVTENHII